MEKEKVKSANVWYLFGGLVYLGAFLFGVGSMIPFVIQKHEYGVLPLLLFLFFITGGGAAVMLSGYKNRKEFYIYSLPKTGVVDFDALNKEYTQVKDECGNLYFVKDEDRDLHRMYDLLQK